MGGPTMPSLIVIQRKINRHLRPPTDKVQALIPTSPAWRAALVIRASCPRRSGSGVSSGVIAARDPSPLAAGPTIQMTTSRSQSEQFQIDNGLQLLTSAPLHRTEVL